MARIALIVIALVFVTGAAGAPTPAPGRADMAADLRAAIEDEQRAHDLLAKQPPRYGTAWEHLERSKAALARIVKWLPGTTLPQSVELDLRNAFQQDGQVNFWLRGHGSEPDADDARRSLPLLQLALRLKKRAVADVAGAFAPSGTPQCSDGKDNDGDGITDWKLESGCTSAADTRERSPFSCSVETGIVGGRLKLAGSCSGAFSELEVKLLDDVQLNGRYDIMHAPSCGKPTLDGFRCKTKEGDKNPGHLLDIRLATTSKGPAQRVQLRFFDIRKRQIGRFVFPSFAPPGP